MCMQTWAHPKYGDRMDVGLVRQAQDAVDPLQVSIFLCTAIQSALAPVSVPQSSAGPQQEMLSS